MYDIKIQEWKENKTFKELKKLIIFVAKARKIAGGIATAKFRAAPGIEWEACGFSACDNRSLVFGMDVFLAAASAISAFFFFSSSSFFFFV